MKLRFLALGLTVASTAFVLACLSRDEDCEENPLACAAQIAEVSENPYLLADVALALGETGSTERALELLLTAMELSTSDSSLARPYPGVGGEGVDPIALHKTSVQLTRIALAYSAIGRVDKAMEVLSYLFTG